MDHRGGAEIILNNCNVGQIFMPEGINEAEEKCKKIWKYMLLGDNKEAQKYFIEDISKDKTKEAIQKLVEITPNQATIEIDGKEKIVTLDEIKKGTIVIARPGEKIAVDGEIIERKSTFR